MKNFFAKLIIFAFVLTAPLSFTGDRCPDFKPDCVKSSYAERARAIIVAQHRTVSRRQVHHLAISVAFNTAIISTEVSEFKPLQQYLQDQSLGRAPPHFSTASA